MYFVKIWRRNWSSILCYTNDPVISKHSLIVNANQHILGLYIIVKKIMPVKIFKTTQDINSKPDHFRQWNI